MDATPADQPVHSPDLRTLYPRPGLELLTPDGAPEDDDLRDLLDDLYATGATGVFIAGGYHYVGGLGPPVTANDWARLEEHLAAAPLEVFFYTLHIGLPHDARKREALILCAARRHPAEIEISADGDLLIASWD